MDPADVLAVAYYGRVKRDDLAHLLEDPSMRDYLGKFRTRRMDVWPIPEGVRLVLPKDRSGIIREILFRKAVDYRRASLGTRPTKERRKAFLREMKRRLDEIAA